MELIASLPRVARVCVANQAFFVLHWNLQDILTQTKGPGSGDYPIDQTRCLSLSDIEGIHEDDVVMCRVTADGGETQFCQPAMRFSKNETIAATFTCTGTTLDFACSLETLA